ncbi:MAG: hypothetical protein QM734_02965 [Cyclobacteriaceae bacterium]
MARPKIKPGEQVAIEYFQSKGYTNIVHEPDGQTPPDLLINNSIAVEVRRLNQFKEVDGSTQPLEELEYELLPRMRRTIKSFDSVTTEQSCFLSYDFKRPLAIDNKLLKKIEVVLIEHLNYIDQIKEYEINKNFRLRFFPSTKNFKKPFVFGSYSDGDGGGFVIANIMDSLPLIIKEKEEKIRPYRNKYPTWWLALNDHVGNGLDEIDLQQLQEVFDIETFFQRIFFISMFDSTRGTEFIINQK